MDYRTQKDRVLNLKEFSVGISIKTKDEVGDNDDEQEIMDEIKGAGWTRFKPEGRPITEKDMRKVFRMVDMDKSGHISQLVRLHFTCKYYILQFYYRNLNWDLNIWPNGTELTMQVFLSIEGFFVYLLL